MGLQQYREMRARKGIPVVGEYALRERARVLGQVRVADIITGKRLTRQVGRQVDIPDCLDRLI